MINMDVQIVSNMCKCITIIFHIVVAGTYVLPYKMKSWRGIYFGDLAIWENPPNLIPSIIIFNA